jgi:hypothetical protein
MGHHKASHGWMPRKIIKRTNEFFPRPKLHFANVGTHRKPVFFGTKRDCFGNTQLISVHIVMAISCQAATYAKFSVSQVSNFGFMFVCLFYFIPKIVITEQNCFFFVHTHFHIYHHLLLCVNDRVDWK